jgi:hypothetical protein
MNKLYGFQSVIFTIQDAEQKWENVEIPVVDATRIRQGTMHA